MVYVVLGRHVLAHPFGGVREADGNLQRPRAVLRPVVIDEGKEGPFLGVQRWVEDEALLLTVNGRKVVVVFPAESVARTPMVWAPLESAAVFSAYVQAAMPVAATKGPPST